MLFARSGKPGGVFGLALLPAFAMLFVIPAAQGQSGIVPGHFRFKTFNVPNQTQLGVEQVNNYGLIVGYYKSVTGPFRGFERFRDGNLKTLIDPRDVEGPIDFFGGETYAEGVNDVGVVVGQYFDTFSLNYAGFFFIKGSTPPTTSPAISTLTLWASTTK